MQNCPILFSKNFQNPNPILKYWKHQAHPDPQIYDRFFEAETEILFKDKKLDWNILTRLGQMSADSCEFQLNNEKIMKKIREAKFDLVFGHTTDFCWLGIVHLFKIPSFVWHYEGVLGDVISYFLRIPGPPSYVPHFYQTFNDEMNFNERTLNGLTTTLTPLVLSYCNPSNNFPQITLIRQIS